MSILSSSLRCFSCAAALLVTLGAGALTLVFTLGALLFVVSDFIMIYYSFGKDKAAARDKPAVLLHRPAHDRRVHPACITHIRSQSPHRRGALTILPRVCTRWHFSYEFPRAAPLQSRAADVIIISSVAIPQTSKQQNRRKEMNAKRKKSGGRAGRAAGRCSYACSPRTAYRRAAASP